MMVATLVLAHLVCAVLAYRIGIELELDRHGKVNRGYLRFYRWYCIFFGLIALASIGSDYLTNRFGGDYDEVVYLTLRCPECESTFDVLPQLVSGARKPNRCPAEYHAHHIEDSCLGKLSQCWKDAGHDMRGWHRNPWHRNPEGDVTWNFDHRESCPREKREAS